MTRTPKDTTPRPRPSRGKSGKPPAPPAEGLSGTPETKRSARGLREGAAPRFDSYVGPAGPADSRAESERARSTLPALRQVGPPSRNFADLTASLNALLAKPQERSERAQQVLAQQPMLARHPLVSGQNPLFTPHRPPRPEKSEGGIAFAIISDLTPRGDQPAAIEELVKAVAAHERNQVLLGVTGSGKTYTMAQVIARTGRPALVLAPNKTLAAQLYGEFKSFFPHNAVEYFVSYYDYYQPEAYVPRTDTYIEKESSINEHIEQMRLSATKALLERSDSIIVATVSSIYGLGDPEAYLAMVLHLKRGDRLDQRALLRRLAEMQYTRNELDLTQGNYRVRGDVIDIFPAESEREAVRVELFDDTIDSITLFDPLTGAINRKLPRFTVYPGTHYVTPRERLVGAVDQIREDLRQRLKELRDEGRLVEAQRLEQRTRFDMEMIKEVGYCAGIENYSRYLSGRAPGEPPPCLFDYLPKNALL